MKRVASALSCFFLLAGLITMPAALRAQHAAAATERGATTVVVVRHAEKSADDPRDPSLSEAGRARSRALLSALEDAAVAAVYVTQFRRTRETAAPLAQRFGLEPTERPVAAAGAEAQAAELAREVLAAHVGRTVLVVGHSNTVPELVRAFSGHTVPPISESEYDQLYVVSVPGSGPARLFRTRYGSPSGTADVDSAGCRTTTGVDGPAHFCDAVAAAAGIPP